MEPLAVLFAAPSAASYRAHLYLARGVRRVGEQALDDNEKIEVEAIDLEEAVRAVASNRIFQDLSSTAALLLAWQRLRGKT
jgi:hypothetical protein